MRTVAFDTHAQVKRLVAAGFTETQAEAEVQVISELIEDQLATKRDIESIRLEIESIRREIELLRLDMKEMETGLRRDIASMETGLRRDMKQMETNIQRDIKESESRMTIRLGLMMAGAIAVVAALVKLL
jgi:hypothetical protein